MIEDSTIQQLHFELVKQAIDLNLTVPESSDDKLVYQSTAFGEKPFLRLQKKRDFLNKFIPIFVKNRFSRIFCA